MDSAAMYAETKKNHESPQNIRMTGRVFPAYTNGVSL
jgi:hypothetical protein